MKHRRWMVALTAAAAVAAVLIAANLIRTSVDGGATAPTNPSNPSGTSGMSGSPSAQPTQVSIVPPTTPPLRSRASMFFPAKALYTGHSADRRITIAIAVEKGLAVGYVCDGRSLDAWLTGTAVDGMVSLRSKKRGDELQAWLDQSGNRLYRSLSVEGYRHGFDTQPSRPPAALYRGQTTVNGQSTTIGWILLPDGSRVGVTTTGTTKTPAPTLRLKDNDASAMLNGTPVPARPVTGATTL